MSWIGRFAGTDLEAKGSNKSFKGFSCVNLLLDFCCGTYVNDAHF